MADVRELEWGQPAVPKVPPAQRAYWGARLLHAEVKAGASGILPDRQGLVGDPDDRAELADRLNELDGKRGGGPLRKAWTEYAFHVDGSSRDVQVVFEDETVGVAATPSGSHGYLYTIAWLKWPVDQTAPDPERELVGADA
jgi:hypothetical protein